MKSPLFYKRKVSPLFFLGMLFLVFPFYYAIGEPDQYWIWLTSVLFGLGYSSLLYTRHPLYEKLIWCYLIAYIIVSSFGKNIQFSLFIFNLSNLLTWEYHRDRWSYRTISYSLLLLAILVWSLIGPFEVELKIFLLIIHAFGLLMMIGGRLQQRKEEMEAQLREQNASINLLLAETERNRIGQDLHDTLGHVFAMLSIKADLIQTLLEHKQLDQAKKEAAELQGLSRNAMTEVRQIVQSLKQHRVEEEIQILQQMFQLAGVSYQVEGQEWTNQLSLPIQDKLTMVLRELGNNLLKHSQASCCRLYFQKEAKELLLVYEDDGVGFGELDGSELHTIRDRLTTIKGSLTFHSKADPTCLHIRIPLEEVV